MTITSSLGPNGYEVSIPAPVSGGGGGVSVAAGSTAAASANVSAIQAALDAGGYIQITVPGIVYINVPLLHGDDTTLVVGAGTEIRLTPGANCNLLKGRNHDSAFVSVSSLTCASGTTATATCGHGKTVGSYGYRLIYGAAPDVYNGTFRVYYATSSTFEYQIASKTPLDALATPATGTIYSAEGNGNFHLQGGVWNYDRANQGAADSPNKFAINVRRIAKSSYCPDRIIGVAKYAISLVNSQDCKVWGVDFETYSDGLHLGGGCKNIFTGGFTGNTGDDMFAVTQGDYANYMDDGYILATFDNIFFDGGATIGAYDSCRIVPAGGYTCGNFIFSNISGRISGGSAVIQLMFDTGVVGQDRVTPITNGTINAFKVVNVDNQTSSIKPLIQVSCNVTTLQANNVTAKFADNSNSAAVLITSTGAVSNIIGSGWDIRGSTAQTASGINVNGSGTLGNVLLDNIKFDYLSALVKFNPSSIPTGRLQVSNVVGDHSASLLTTAVRASGNVPIPVKVTNFDWLNNTGAAFTGTAATAQIFLKLVNQAIGTNAVVAGTWLNKCVDFGTPQQQTITYASTITPDAAQGDVVVCTFTGAMTIAAPSSIFAGNGQGGRKLKFILIRNTASAAAITWNAAYVFPTAFVDSSANSTRTVVEFVHDDNGKFVAQGANVWA